MTDTQLILTDEDFDALLAKRDAFVAAVEQLDEAIDYYKACRDQYIADGGT